MKRLKIFQMRVADPSTKERLNELLAASSADYRATASYYEDRPQLGEYTVNTEIKRMTYTVVPPQGGEAISDVEGIRSIYAASAGTDPGACRGRGKDSMGTGGGQGAGSANVDLVWRMANQSLLAGIAQPLHDTFGTPEDVELCISIHNTASAFHVNLHEAYVEATTDFKIATVGVGGSGAEADMLPLAHITGEIRVGMPYALLLEAWALCPKKPNSKPSIINPRPSKSTNSARHRRDPRRRARAASAAGHQGRPTADGFRRRLGGGGASACRRRGPGDGL